MESSEEHIDINNASLKLYDKCTEAKITESFGSCTIKGRPCESYNKSADCKELPEACEIHLNIKDEPELCAEKCVINVLPLDSCDKDIKCESLESCNEHNDRESDSLNLLNKHLPERKNGIKPDRCRSHEQKMIFQRDKKADTNNQAQGLEHDINQGQAPKYPDTFKAIEKGDTILGQQDQFGIMVSRIEALNRTLGTTNKNLEAVGKRFDSFMREASNDRSYMKDLIALLVEKITPNNNHNLPRQTVDSSSAWKNGNSNGSFVLTHENNTESLKSQSPLTAHVINASPVHTTDTRSSRTTSKLQGLIHGENSAKLYSNLSYPTIVAENLEETDTQDSVMDIVSESTKSCDDNSNLSFADSMIEQESNSQCITLNNTLQEAETQILVDNSMEVFLNESCAVDLEKNYINEGEITSSIMEIQTLPKNLTKLSPLVSSTIPHISSNRNIKRNSPYDLRERNTKTYLKEDATVDMTCENHSTESDVPSESEVCVSNHEAGKENENPKISETETTEMNKSEDKNSDFRYTLTRRKRTQRPCPFCQMWVIQLSRHLLIAHSSENEIKFINSIKNKEQKVAELKKLRLRGVAIQNEIRRAKGEELIAVRRCFIYKERPKSMCLNCKGIYSSRNIDMHKRNCYKIQSSVRDGSISVKMLHSQSENDKNCTELRDHYQDNILIKLSTDIIETIIRNEPLLQQIGFDLYQRIRHKREMPQTRRRVLNVMRTVCSIFYELNKERRQRRRIEILFSDLFDVDMYEEIKKTIFRLNTKSYKDENQYDNYLKISARALMLYYQECHNFDEMNIVQAFYNHVSMNSAKLTEESVKSCNRISRISNYVLQISDFDKVKQVIMEPFTEIRNPSSIVDKDSYIKLRRAVLCRLTFFNGRCPTEVANLKIVEWELAKSNAHIPDEQLKSLLEAEKTIFISFKIANNGSNKDADILIPESCFNAINILCDSEIRRNAQVIVENPYVFASINSPDTAFGYHDIDYVLKEAQLPIKSCSIQLRHILSTDLRNLDCDTNLRQLCYDHMDHSAEISQSESQIPKVRDALLNIGSILAQIESRTSRQADEVDALNKEISCDKSSPSLATVIGDEEMHDCTPVYREREKQYSVSFEDHFEAECEAGNKNEEAEINIIETTELNKSEEKKSNFESTNTRKKRMQRPCPFCQKWVIQLSRHLLKSHKSENEIKVISNLKNKKKKVSELKKLRLKGIAIQNEKRRAKGEELIAVRRCFNYEEHTKSMCLNCKGIYSRKNIYVHKKNCYKEQSSVRGGSIRVEMLNSVSRIDQNNSELIKHYIDNILNKLRTDIIGTIIRKEPLLQQIGFEYYESIRQNKEMQHVRRIVLAHMRTICSVFYNLNLERRQRRRVEISFSDLFDVDMYEEIKRTIFRLSTKSDTLENDQSSKVGSVERYDQSLKLSARALIFYYRRCNKYEEMNIVQTFYTHASMNSAKLTGESIKSKRNRRSRTTNYVLQQSDFEKVKQVIMETFTEFGNPSSKIDKYSYVKLRRVVFCRLTFFNGLCPTEVANLKITEWKLAKSNAHIPDEQLKSLLEAEKTVFDSFKIANNGSNKDADILIPESCFNALNILCDSEIRRNAQVIVENPYVFASTNSPDAASGYHDIDNVFKEAQLPCSIKLRYFLPTEFLKLDCDTNLRQLCYDHMSHSAEISQSKSQMPKVQEVLRNIGSLLVQIESRTSRQTDEVDAINKEMDCDKSSPSIEKEEEDKDVQDRIAVYRKKEKCSKNQPSVPNEDRLELRESDDSENKKKKYRFRVGWTEDDRIIIRTSFQGFIEGSKPYPNPREVDKFLRRNKTFLKHIKSNSEKRKRLRIQLQNYKKKAMKI